MSSISIQYSDEFNGFYIESPGHFEGRLKFSVPEFHGKIQESQFSIKQSIRADAGTGSPISFDMDIDPIQAGIGFSGNIATTEGDEVAFATAMTNRKVEAIENAHHTFVLDVSEAPAFLDPDGERTMMYTETGWESLAHLSNEPGITFNRVHRPFNVGAAYNKTTIMWRTLARWDIEKKMLLALAISNGYCFASDHYLFEHCMIGGGRWGTVQPDDGMGNFGRIYLHSGSLDDMRTKYNQDFKGGE